MIRIALITGFAMLAPFSASAQTSDQLVKGATDTSGVLNYGMGYNLQRFSPLTQINKDNAKNLVPVWNYSLADDRAEESQPIVYQGVIYVTTHAATMAVDAKTGLACEDDKHGLRYVLSLLWIAGLPKRCGID